MGVREGWVGGREEGGNHNTSVYRTRAIVLAQADFDIGSYVQTIYGKDETIADERLF